MVRLSFQIFGWMLLFVVPLAYFKGLSVEHVARGALAAAAVFACLGPFLALVVQPLGLHVHAEGIVGRTFWGPRRFLSWAEIGEQTIDGSSGVAFLWIHSRNGDQSPLCTVPDVATRPEFQRMALQLGGADCLIVAPDAAYR